MSKNYFVFILLLSYAVQSEILVDKLCEYREITSLVNNELRICVQKSHPNSVLKNGQVLWPECEFSDKKVVKNVNSKSLKIAMYWIDLYIVRQDLNNINTNVVLTGMANDDDWIINRFVSPAEYCQFVDGRSLTVLMKVKINITDTTFLKKKIQASINRYVRFDCEKYEMNFMNIDSEQVDISIMLPVFDNITGKKGIRIWTNGSYLILDIPKIGMPFVDKFGYSIERTLGGISDDDQRPFHRFRSENNIDMKKEFFKHFPWIEDSMKIWRKRADGGGKAVVEYNDK